MEQRQGDTESLLTIVSWTPVPTGFDLETLSPVEVKRLFVFYFLPKALTFAFALPLKQRKQDYVISRRNLPPTHLAQPVPLSLAWDPHA
jgi:hypothetical protein